MVNTNKNYNNKLRWHVSILIGIFFMILFINIGLGNVNVEVPKANIDFTDVGNYLLILLGTGAISLWTFLALRKFKVIESFRDN